MLEDEFDRILFLAALPGLKDALSNIKQSGLILLGLQLKEVCEGENETQLDRRLFL